MRLEDLDYPLDPAHIAQTPIEPRDAAKLLVDRGDAAPEHRHVTDLPDLLEPGDLLVVNETRSFRLACGSTGTPGERPRSSCSNPVTRIVAGGRHWSGRPAS